MEGCAVEAVELPRMRMRTETDAADRAWRRARWHRCRQGCRGSSSRAAAHVISQQVAATEALQTGHSYSPLTERATGTRPLSTSTGEPDCTKETEGRQRGVRANGRPQGFYCEGRVLLDPRRVPCKPRIQILRLSLSLTQDQHPFTQAAARKVQMTTVILGIGARRLLYQACNLGPSRWCVGYAVSYQIHTPAHPRGTPFRERTFARPLQALLPRLA